MEKSFWRSLFLKEIPLALVLLVLSLVLPIFLIKFGLIVFATLFGLFTLLLIILIELHGKALHIKSSWLVVLLIFSLPFQRVFLTSYPAQAVGQFFVFIVIFFCWYKSSSIARFECLRRIKIIFFPTAFFVFVFYLSYLISGKLGTKDWSFLLNIIGGVGYAYLACLYCNSLEKIKKIFWVFIAVGVFQLPIMFAMSRGWTDNLPGNLSLLNSSLFGGLASSSNMNTLRYPGIFGSFELVAEYFDLMIIICIGFSILNHHNSKSIIFSFLSILIMLIGGFFTGSRSFILDLGIGLVVMVLLMIIKPGFGKNLVGFLIIGGFITLIIFFLSKQEVFSAYIGRFLNTEISSTFFDTRNGMIQLDFTLMQKMPFFGYGSSMMDIYITQLGAIVADPHSLYFAMILTAGVPGLVTVLILVLTPILGMLRIIFNKNTKEYHTWAIIFLSLLICWAFNEVIIEFIRYAFYMDIIFFIMGIIAGFYNLACKENIKLQGV